MTRRPDWHTAAMAALPYLFLMGALGFVGAMVLR